MPRLSIETRATLGLMPGGAIAGAAAGIIIAPLGLFGAMARLAITHRDPARVLTGERARSLRAPK